MTAARAPRRRGGAGCSRARGPAARAAVLGYIIIIIIFFFGSLAGLCPWVTAVPVAPARLLGCFGLMNLSLCPLPLWLLPLCLSSSGTSTKIRHCDCCCKAKNNGLWLVNL